MSKITTTRRINLDGTNWDISANVNDSNKTIELYFDDDPDQLYVFPRNEFLDFVVACWPDSVAYQFKDDDDD